MVKFEDVSKKIGDNLSNIGDNLGIAGANLSKKNGFASNVKNGFNSLFTPLKRGWSFVRDVFSRCWHVMKKPAPRFLDYLLGSAHVLMVFTVIQMGIVQLLRWIMLNGYDIQAVVDSGSEEVRFQLATLYQLHMIFDMGSFSMYFLFMIVIGVILLTSLTGWLVIWIGRLVKRFKKNGRDA